jgi:hypothetical protein
MMFFHASQVGCTPVVKRSNVLHIRNVENIVGLAFRKLMGSSAV